LRGADWRPDWADMDANAAKGLLTKQASEAAYDASRKLMSTPSV